MNKLKIIASAALALSASFAFADRLANIRYVGNQFDRYVYSTLTGYDFELTITNKAFSVTDNGEVTAGFFDLYEFDGDYWRTNESAEVRWRYPYVYYDKYLNKHEEIRTKNKLNNNGYYFGDTEGNGMYALYVTNAVVDIPAYKNFQSEQIGLARFNKNGLYLTGNKDDMYYVHGSNIATIVEREHFQIKGGSPLINPAPNTRGFILGSVDVTPFKIELKTQANNRVFDPKRVNSPVGIVVSDAGGATNRVEVRQGEIEVHGANYTVISDKYGNQKKTGAVEISGSGIKIDGRDVMTYVKATDGTIFKAVNNGGTLSWEVVQQ